MPIKCCGRRSKRRIGDHRKRKNQSSMTTTEVIPTICDKSTNTSPMNVTLTTGLSPIMCDKSTNTNHDIPISTIPTTHDKSTNTGSTMPVDDENVFKVAAKPILSSGWFFGDPQDTEEIRLFHVAHLESSVDRTNEPLKITKSLIVMVDHTWVAFINGLPVQHSCSALHDIPDVLTCESFLELVTRLQTYYTCIGNGDSHFVKMCEIKKGKFLSIKKELVAFIHETDLCKVVRHVSCELLVNKEDQRCTVCQAYRARLRAMYSSSCKSNLAANKTNLRFLQTPQHKSRIVSLRKRIKNIKAKNRRLSRLLNEITSTSGITTDALLEQDLVSTIGANKEQMEQLPQDDFRRIFWEQQSAALKVKGKSAIRWHPLFVRWALNLMLSSPKAYNIIRESGVIVLPSKRTLKDYTHWFRSDIGFQNEAFQQLQEDYKVTEFNEAQRHIVLVFDEMKIQESLVFDSKSGNIIGYVDVGDMNMQLKNFEANLEEKAQEKEVATHMLMLYVRGIFTKMEYPLAQFPTTGISGKELYDLVWTAIRRLREVGLNVTVIVSDGASTNRTFFKLHKDTEYMKKGVVYKAQNIFDPSKFIWFMSDICHLLKTTRNCWENSSRNGTRHLENNGKHILWSHLITLYEKTREDSGLYIGHKLKQEHIRLTSYSRMNVRLAAQVLSRSVANSLSTLCQLSINPSSSVYSDTTETEKFCLMFNRLFDCFNTRHLMEATQKANDDLKPYSTMDDIRLKWLENEFLKYLDNWEAYALSKEGISTKEREKLTLSKQTKEGLKITVLSFVEVIPYLLSLEGAKFIYSERFNQDTLEAFFGKQRARCGRSDNPTVNQFTYNTQTIRIGRSLSFGGSSSVKRKLFTKEDVQDLSQPLRKKKKVTK